MSTGDPRIRRPKLPRTRAYRSLATLFAAPGAAPSSGPWPGISPGGQGGEAWNDVIARSVDLGYRVIDDYVRQGERVARAVGERGPVTGPAAAFADTQDIARRMGQYAMEVTTLWYQLLQGTQSASGWPFPAYPGFAMPRAPEAGGAAHDGDAARKPPVPPAAPNGAKPVRVAVSVSSARATEVVLDLRPEAGARRMVVQSLRSPDPGPPRIADVALTGDGVETPFTLRVHVPDDQPAGIYNGIVIEEESGLPLGTVSLRVKHE